MPPVSVKTIGNAGFKLASKLIFPLRPILGSPLTIRLDTEQLADTTMNPEKRTLLTVRLEDVVATDLIFTTLMGEDVESRRKFIEENALDVKNLDV